MNTTILLFSFLSLTRKLYNWIFFYGLGFWPSVNLDLMGKVISFFCNHNYINYTKILDDLNHTIFSHIFSVIFFLLFFYLRLPLSSIFCFVYVSENHRSCGNHYNTNYNNHYYFFMDIIGKIWYTFKYKI